MLPTAKTGMANINGYHQLGILPLEHDHGQTDSRARTTIVSSSSQSHVVDPDWIHILGKQRLPCVKGKVTVCKGKGHCNVSVLRK